MATIDDNQGQLTEAFRAGRRVGLGISALALSLVAFLSMLGAEKAILAMVLGVFAIRGARRGATARRLGVAAISIGSVFIASALVVLIVFWDQVLEFVHLLSKLS